MRVTHRRAQTTPRHITALVAVTCLVVLGLSSSALAQEQQATTTYRRSINNTPLVLAPNFAGYLGFSNAGSRTDGPHTHLSLWGGISGNLVVRPGLMTFVSGGVEIEHQELRDGREAMYMMPMFQSGISFTGCHDTQRVLAAMIPCAKIYGLASFRPGMPGQNNALRLGVGVSSLWLSAIAIGAGAFLPSHYEYIVESDLQNPERTVHMFRLGLGF